MKSGIKNGSCLCGEVAYEIEDNMGIFQYERQGYFVPRKIIYFIDKTIFKSFE